MTFPSFYLPRSQCYQSVTTGHKTFSSNKQSPAGQGGARAGGRAADAPAAPGPAQPPRPAEVPARAALWRPRVPVPGSARTGSGASGQGREGGSRLRQGPLPPAHSPGREHPSPGGPWPQPAGQQGSQQDLRGLVPSPTLLFPVGVAITPDCSLPRDSRTPGSRHLSGLLLAPPCSEGTVQSQERGWRWGLTPRSGILATYPRCGRGQLRDPVPSGRGHSPAQARRGHEIRQGCFGIFDGPERGCSPEFMPRGPPTPSWGSRSA